MAVFLINHTAIAQEQDDPAGWRQLAVFISLPAGQRPHVEIRVHDLRGRGDGRAAEGRCFSRRSQLRDHHERNKAKPFE